MKEGALYNTFGVYTWGVSQTSLPRVSLQQLPLDGDFPIEFYISQACLLWLFISKNTYILGRVFIISVDLRIDTKNDMCLEKIGLCAQNSLLL